MYGHDHDLLSSCFSPHHDLLPSFSLLCNTFQSGATCQRRHTKLHSLPILYSRINKGAEDSNLLHRVASALLAKVALLVRDITARAEAAHNEQADDDADDRAGTPTSSKTIKALSSIAVTIITASGRRWRRRWWRRARGRKVEYRVRSADGIRWGAEERLHIPWGRARVARHLQGSKGRKEGAHTHGQKKDTRSKVLREDE